ncbi:trifunctional transcriptional regulator/proline dehydrogenase/L-glutamate gamma-semialdehyde dehydrogenase [Pantoea sp. Aalb]|uniref:trifunctional transcriptional regulator/proline dehydrogenase/L-glutamate gamma-semialdehyde dehydrogenase n=1 Tax=Pantoea sp. Aalb TaxID=2576762 RepID=UPI0013220A9C|nr:trifunctional transcriptional regulator/proline dehydrogenase/L-glutamate gamma-semialdehyde dehydrogenase [Pantoea sp. Aalb]MXP67341.1 trifunctional transcriptional regulator/proline dehydrogenase/L-glutamate gamma-semialdehyde dehydrogenase [Pantoea sp. Aalb]
MLNTNMGVKLDKTTCDRIKITAQKMNRTPHWLIKQAIFNYLDQLEASKNPIEIPSQLSNKITKDDHSLEKRFKPFEDFAESILPQSVIRSTITKASRCLETDAVPIALELARFPALEAEKIHELAYSLTHTLRNQKSLIERHSIVQSLLQEFSLSSDEGIALMCLAEALLRIPDKSTRDLLIRNKINNNIKWQSHLGASPSMFVNAATWGLLLTSRVVSIHKESNIAYLKNIIDKSGKPLIRKSLEMAMRLIGKQFVTGETISEALNNVQKLEEKGFRYSYDMLGEAALTYSDAKAYLLSYQQAIHAIGKASNGRGIYEGPGISIKLSALHPRYNRAQYERVIKELYPILKSLTILARSYDIGITIDAEEADRLEISLDLLEKLCFEPELKNWNGIGFVIQAYQKRSLFVIDFISDLAQRSYRRLMIRLVKGAYWDTEIKRTQVAGLEDYPVYTRKVYTDISYLACARKLLSIPNFIYPQFATHNACTLAAIYQLAGNNYYFGQYEFQCLHGMGEPLYKNIVGKVSDGKLNRPCRIYAPVGTHETLLAYLVRRLLENGANTSFINRIADNTIPIEELVADPVSIIQKMGINEGMIGLPHLKIPLPRSLYGDKRINSFGIDLNNEHSLASLSSTLFNSIKEPLIVKPIIIGKLSNNSESRQIINPAKIDDIVGNVYDATEEEISQALDATIQASLIWSTTSPQERAKILEIAANMMESQMQRLIGLLVRESGKTYNNAIAEIREAVDFLYYYAEIIREDFNNNTYRPLGPVVCISPWNFPLAIFIGQIAAALAAGNSVLAKPAEQTPIIAAQAVHILLEAGIPAGVLQMLPGSGEIVGMKLIEDERIRGVMFTGSTLVAKLLNHSLAGRLDSEGHPIPIIAETGGINAMIVDSSALIQQVVDDILISAFDSAGQRCSSLRLLCLQEEVADYTLKMLKGAMAECRMGNPERLSTDIGPVIDIKSKINIERHIQKMRIKGFSVYQSVLENKQDSKDCSSGNFITPTIIEINQVKDLDKEVFGPVLHVIKFKRSNLFQMINQINSSGYGLTLGIHTRIDETITQIINKAKVGNIYVNRNMIGAVVGVQPFGGEGLSGTGPKAGGPLYLYRLLAYRPDNALRITFDRQNNEISVDSVIRDELVILHQAFLTWVKNKPEIEAIYQRYYDLSQSGTVRLLSGPTGERNTYSLIPKDCVLCLSNNEQDILIQLAAVISVGSRIIWQNDELHSTLRSSLPYEVQKYIKLTDNVLHEKFDAVIYHGNTSQLNKLCKDIASIDRSIITVQGFVSGETNLLIERLLIERSISINTTAAGGNIGLMTIN